MKVIDSKDIPYRHNTHGPKYLMEGPLSKFGIVKLLPKEVASGHVHKIMEENFYVLEGAVQIKTDKETFVLLPGQFLNVPANTPHEVSNPFDTTLKMVISLAPASEGDKYPVEF